MRPAPVHLALVLALAGCVSVAAPSGPAAKVVTFYTPRPLFEWPGSHAETFRYVLAARPKGAAAARIIASENETTQRSWQPDFDLDFDTRYELLVVTVPAGRPVAAWKFTIGYQSPELLMPRHQSKVRSLSPTFRWVPAEYAHIWWHVEVAEDGNFDSPVEETYLPQRGNVRNFAGPDHEIGTADDVRMVEWKMRRLLKVNHAYQWRLTALYFLREELKGDVRPDFKNPLAKKLVVASFTVPPQSGSDSLSSITRVTTEPADAFQSSMSQNLELSYVLVDRAGWSAGAELRVAGATLRDGRPTFDRGREAFTAKFEASVDEHPQWDVDGEGIFFNSNRADRRSAASNIWYKRRDSRGYTQLTFHETSAAFPTVSRDGNRVAYQVLDPKASEGNKANSADAWTIWTVDRDGKAPTEIGKGEFPRFSPDGKRLAFALLNELGCHQIWSMAADGSDRVQLTNDQYDNSYPAWHPGGKRLVYVSDRGTVCRAAGEGAGGDDANDVVGNEDLWEIELAGARATQLTNYLGRDVWPEYTPDGRFVIFSSTRGGDVFNIWMGRLGE